MRIVILICAALLILSTPSHAAAPPSATAAWAGPHTAVVRWAPGYGAVAVAHIRADGAVTWSGYLSQARGGVCVGPAPSCIEATVGAGDRFVVRYYNRPYQETTAPLMAAGSFVYLPLAVAP